MLLPPFQTAVKPSTLPPVHAWKFSVVLQPACLRLRISDLTECTQESLELAAEKEHPEEETACCRSWVALLTEPVKDCDAAGQCCVLDHSLKIQTFNTLRSEMSGAAALQ